MNSTDNSHNSSFKVTMQPNIANDVLDMQTNLSLNNEILSLDCRINEMSIFFLPKDALLITCSFFSPKELVKLGFVSKNFKEIANFSEIWKSFCESFGVIRLEDFISLSEKDLTWKKLYFHIKDDNKFFDPVKSLKITLNDNCLHLNNIDLPPVSIDYYSDRLKGINIKRITKKQLGLNYKIQDMALIFCGKKIKDNDLIKPIFSEKGKDCEFRITLKITPISQEELENADTLKEDEEVYLKTLEITQEEIENPDLMDILDEDDIFIEEDEEGNSNHSNIGFCITM